MILLKLSSTLRQSYLLSDKTPFIVACEKGNLDDCKLLHECHKILLGEKIVNFTEVKFQKKADLILALFDYYAFSI